MRVSGVVLVVLVFGHLFVNLMLGEGIKAIDFGFVAGKWATPFWQVWDLLMLWLADAPRRQRHAHDHQRLRRARRHRGCVLKGLLLAASVVLILSRHPGDLHLRPVPGRRAATTCSPSFCTEQQQVHPP